MQVASGVVSDGARKKSGSLAIGCFGSICRDRLGDRLVAFAQTWPGVDIGVHEMTRTELIAKVRCGELALAVTPCEVPPDLQSAHIWSDEVLVAMAANHPLARIDLLALSDLNDQQFLISRQQHGGDMHRFLANRIMPFDPSRGILCNMGLPRLFDLVAAGEGLALTCASHAALTAQRVSSRRVDSPGAHFPVRALWRPASPEWPLKALVAMLQS